MDISKLQNCDSLNEPERLKELPDNWIWKEKKIQISSPFSEGAAFNWMLEFQKEHEENVRKINLNQRKYFQFLANTNTTECCFPLLGTKYLVFLTKKLIKDGKLDVLLSQYSNIVQL
jgi:hypothetical protein